MRKVLLIAMAMVLMASYSFATVVPGITTIHDIQFTSDPGTDDASPLAGDTVTVEGWVTFEPMSRNTAGYAFWMADAAGAWNGIYVYKSSAGWDFAFGTKVRVTGVVSEYSGFTELMPWSADSVTVLDDAVDWTDLPAACAYTVVPAADLSAAGTAEQYESVLVQVDDVTTSNTDLGYGEWEVSDASSNAVVVDNPQNSTFGYFHKVMADEPFVYVRGVLQYNYGAYKIVPEISRDLKTAEDPASGWYTQFSFFQQVRPSDMDIKIDGSNNYYMLDESYSSNARYAYFDSGITGKQDTVTVRGIVTMPTGLSYAGAGIKFIMADATYGLDADPVEQPWSAVLSYDPDSTAFPVLLEGDEVVVTGYISEYQMNAGNMTELFITEAITVPSFDNPVPAPVQVDVPDVRTPRVIEKYETGFVYILSSVVADNNTTGWSSVKFAIDDNTTDEYKEISIDGDSDFSTSPEVDNWVTFGTPPVGANVDSVTGWVYPHYGDYNDATDPDLWIYKIEPKRPLTDIVIGEGPPVIASASRDLTVPTPSDPVVVSAEITDDVNVDSAKVFYKMGIDGTWSSVAMDNGGSGSTYTGSIPAGADGESYFYFVEAYDTWEDLSVHYSLMPSDTARGLYGYTVRTGGQLEIADVQYTPFADNNSLYAGYEVTVSGTVIDSFDIANQYGYTDGCAYYIQSGTDAEWNAMLVHINATDMAVGSQVQAGDNITVTGTVYEQTGSSKFDFNTRLRDVGANYVINSTGNAINFFDIPVTDLTGTPELYESQAVRVMNPTFVQKNSYDWTFEDADGHTFLVDDDMIKYAASNSTISEWFAGLADGSSETNPAWIRGIWMYSYGTWKLEPRLWYDVDGLADPNNGVNEAGLPKVFALYPVYPNPFNPSTTVSFQLPKNTVVKAVVYNMLGQKVRTLIDKPMVQGQHSVMWHGVNEANVPVASGVYFLRFDAADFHKMQKMVLIK